MYILDINALQPGDIVLTARDAKLSKGIRRLTGSNYSHAILYVAQGSYVHSDGGGVHADNPQRLLLSKPSQALALRPVRDEDKAKITQICDFARSQIGKQYSVPEAIASRKKRSGGVDLHSNRQFCSRLVAQAYAYAGIALVPTPDYCYPSDLYNTTLLAVVPNCVQKASEAEIKFARSPSPLEIQAKAMDHILAAARTSSGEDVQNEEQLVSMLLRKPELDEEVSTGLIESGYLDLWRMDVERNPWRYEEAAFKNVNPSTELREAEIASAAESIRRFALMQEQYTALQQQRPLKYFALQVALYKGLISLHLKRQAVMRGRSNA